MNARRWDEAGGEPLGDQLRERRHARREPVLRMFHNAAQVDAARPAIPMSMLFFPRDAGPAADLRSGRRAQEIGLHR